MSERSKVALVTGATDGIGRATALELARRGMTVLIHGRDERRLQETAFEIADRSGNRSIETLRADFSSLAEVRALAGAVLDCTDRLDVLVNNAGVYVRTREVSADGYELTFAVNHLAPVLLTELLLPLLRTSAPSRVVLVSSVAHTRAVVEWDNLEGKRSYDHYQAYALSKLANVVYAMDLAERLSGSGVTANALHPGVVATKMLRTGFPHVRGIDQSRGAETSVFVATDASLDGITGAYFSDRQRVPASPLAGNREVRAGLMDRTRTMVRLESPD